MIAICAWPGSISARLQLPNARLQLRNVRLHLPIRTCQLASPALVTILASGHVGLIPNARLQLAGIALALRGARQRALQHGWRRLLCEGRLAGFAILRAMHGFMRPMLWLSCCYLGKV